MEKQTAILLRIKEKKGQRVWLSVQRPIQFISATIFTSTLKYLDLRFLNNTPFHRLLRCLCRELVENDGNNWHLKRQCLPLRLISDGVNSVSRLSDFAPSVLGGLGEVRKPCQCVFPFNSIKHRFKLQIKMQITSVITASERTGRDKGHPFLSLPALMKYKPLFNVKLNLIRKNKVSQNTLSPNRFCTTCVM